MAGLILVLQQPTPGLPAGEVPPASAAAADTFVVSAVGDVMLGGRLLPVLREEPPDYPWRRLRGLLDRAGFLIGNLEAPFLTDTTGVRRVEKTYTFAVPPSSVEVLTAAGFDAVTLANNHILDYGMPGLARTWETLREAGIAHAGTGMDQAAAHRPTVVEQEGTRIALLAYNHVFPEEFWARVDAPGTAHARDGPLAREVAAAAALADIVVVSFHWGAELMETPKEYQRILARIAVDNGADMVVGHHPHVVQSFEWYRGGLIAYSLGNFLFGSYSTGARGCLLRARFSAGRIVEAEVHPLDVNNFSVELQPSPLPADRWGRDAGEVIRALADSASAGAVGVVADPAGFLRLLPPRTLRRPPTDPDRTYPSPRASNAGR